MKKILSRSSSFFFLSILTFLTFVIFNSCDKIEPPYTIENENIDLANCPVPVFDTLGNVYKKILVEDFTGHLCGFCPRAHIKLKELITTYGDTIVGIALHVGGYSKPDTSGLFTYDFRTNEGTDIDTKYGISNAGLPKGMINRTQYNGNIIIPKDSWSTVVQSMLTEPARIGIQIINNYDYSDSTFCTHNKITFLENITDTLMFFCCLTEDSIIKPQRNYDATPNDIPAYTHMHVMRDGLNGSIGVKINPGINEKDSSIVKSYSYHLKGKDYVHKNLKIVSYIYNLNTNKVLQAEERKVMP